MLVKHVSAMVFCFFATSISFADDCGIFKVVKGDITVKESGQSEFTKAKINKKVCAGDLIKAGAESRSKVIMADGNEINISPDTEFVIEKYQSEGADKKVLLDVIYGKIRSNVKQKYDGEQSYYRVKTKSAVAGVRGTQFLSSYEPKTNEFKVITFEGVVEVGSLKGDKIVNSVKIIPGYQSTKMADAPPAPPEKININDFKNFDKDSNFSAGPDVKAPASSNDQANTSKPGDGVKNEKNPNGGGSSGPSGNGSNPNGPNANNGGTQDPNSRAPASIGDLPKGGIDIPPPQELVKLPDIKRDIPVFIDPTRNVKVPVCTNCDKIIQGTKSNVHVIVK